MTAQTVEAIDREIATRSEKVAAMSTTMVELDEHPGLQHVKRYPPTGITAQRWVAIEEALGRMWQDLSSMTSILESARTVRARRSNVTDNDRAELTRLLFERPLEVSRQRIPLAQRSITSRAEAVEYAGLADLAERMRTDYRGAVEFLDSVDQINSAVTSGLGPVQDRLDAVGAASPKELIDLLTVSATDPLSLTPPEVDRRIEVIVKAVEKRTAELAEIAALQANWPQEIAATNAQLDTLRDNVDRAVRARALAERTVISGPLPVPTDAEPDLREALRSLTTPDAAALTALRRQIETALRVVSDQEELAQGLLDRRTELAGRLSVYQAKAARLGLAEDSDLLASGRIAAGLLSRNPCDLQAVTRAITDFQNLMAQKQGATK